MLSTQQGSVFSPLSYVQLFCLETMSCVDMDGNCVDHSGSGDHSESGDTSGKHPMTCPEGTVCGIQILGKLVLRTIDIILVSIILTNFSLCFF